MISPCLFVDLQGKHSAFSLLRVGFETQVNTILTNNQAYAIIET